MRPNTYALRYLAAALLPLWLVAGSGCAKEKAGNPAFIEIDTISLNAQNHGSSSSHFTDAWIYINSNLLGAFELPARIPVLQEGNADVIIFPGIQLNGLSTVRTQYLKTVPYQGSLNFVPGQTIKMNPVLKYDSLTVFEYMENFEQAGVTIDKSEGAYGQYTRILGAPQIAFEGGGCGLLTHDGAENTITQIETNNWFTLPKGDVGGIYFELNYKCNTSFTVSLLAKPSDGVVQRIGVIGINPSPTWKKMYVGISSTVNQYTAGNQFKPVIGYSRNPSIPVQEVYIDNLKMLY